MKRLNAPVPEGNASARPFSSDATAGFGRAEAGPYQMNPRKIEVHIEELVLNGFNPHERWQISDTLENELRRLLAEQGVPRAWFSGPDRIDAGVIPPASLTRPAQAGAEIARAACRGGVK